MPRSSLWFHRDFRLLWIGDTVSQFGQSITVTAIPLLAALVLRATPFQMGLLTAADTAGFLLVGLLAGAIVDRVRRGPLMLGTNLARAALLASVPIAWWAGVLTLTQLILVGLAIGVGTVFFDVAYQSYLPTLVARGKLVEGNSKLQASESVAQVSGPALGGWLTQFFGAANAVLANSIGFLVSAFCLWRIDVDEPKPARPEHRNLMKEIAEGLRFVFGNRSLVGIVGCTATFNFFANVTMAVSVLRLTRELGTPPALFGVLAAGASVGGLVGAVFAGRIANKFGQARTIWLSVLVTCPFALLVPLTQRGWLLSFYVLGWLVDSFGGTVYNIAQLSYRQSICPDRLLGRMNASIRFLVWGTMPLGALVGGILGANFGVLTAMWIGAIGIALCPLPVLLSPLRKLRDVPTAVEEEPTSEPVS
jgi:MFS family permease